MSASSALKVCQRSHASALRVARTSARAMSTVAEVKDQLAACREELKQLIDEKNCAPILVRLGWHDAGTYDDKAEGEWPAKGGANGSIRFDTELGHGANAGLKNAVELVEPIKAKFPAVSYADLFQMASATAIEMTGGPKIPMRYGRVDVSAPEQCPKEGNLPGAAAPFPDGAESPAQHVRNVFYRMGMTDKDIVALSGAHTLGRAHKNRSGMGAETTKFTEDSHVARADGKPGIGSTKGGSAWVPKWLKFDNDYFKVLRDDSADPELLKMPTDKALVEDESFRAYAIKYAEDQDAFFADYAVSHAKLSEQGSKFEPAEGIRLD